MGTMPDDRSPEDAPVSPAEASGSHGEAPPDPADTRLMVWERWVLEHAPVHEEVEIPRFTPEHVMAHGYYESMGEPRGQEADYRRRLPDGRGLHVKDYGDRMTLHWDKVDPSHSAIQHLVRDAPLLVAGGLLLGAAGAAALRTAIARRL